MNHDLLPVQALQEITRKPLIAITSPSIDDTLMSETIERNTTPPPPSSSPPPLSPIKADSWSCDNNGEEWNEPQLNNKSFEDNVDHVSCSSLDTDQLSTEDLFNEIDQTANHSNLSATVAMGRSDSLGTVSSLSEDITVSTSDTVTGYQVLPWQETSPDLLIESHNSPPPLPLSPPPDL